MKKVIMLMMVIGLGLTSCNKKDIKPNGNNNQTEVDCNCGIVMYDNIAESRFDPYTTRKIIVRNDCSNNTITIYSNESGHNPFPAPAPQNLYDVGAVGEVYCDLQSW